MPLLPIKEDYQSNQRLNASDFNKVAKIINKGHTIFYNSFSQVDLSILEQGDWVRIAADETNNGDKTMYLYTGTNLEFQYTILST